jgi:hypothetical protein
VEPSTIKVSTFTKDKTGPKLASFHLDLDKSVLFLTFNEPISPQTLKPTQLTIQSNFDQHSPGAVSRQLSGGNLLNKNITITKSFSFELVDDDITFLKKNTSIGLGIETTYLSSSLGSVLDVAGNSLQEISSSSAQRVDQYSKDERSASLRKFSLNLKTRQLILNFDDVMDPESGIDVNVIRIQDGKSASSGDKKYILQDSTSSSETGFVIVVDLSTNDYMGLTSIIDLATSSQDTFIVMAASFVDDVAGNDVIAVTDGRAQQANEVIVDKPRILNFRIDMKHGNVTLLFSFPILPKTFNVTSLSIQNKPNFPSQIYRLTKTNTIFPEQSSHSLTFMFSNEDFNAIQKFHLLAVSEESSYITAESSLIRGEFGDDLYETTALKASGYVDDVIPPELVSFRLDLDVEVLYLSFSETVRVSSLNVSGLIFQSSHTLPKQKYTLRNSVSNSNNTVNITINLDGSDLDNIKALDLMGTQVGNTYLNILPSAIKDMSGTSVIETTLQATELEGDKTSPFLVDFNFNLSSSMLDMKFSETINGSSYNISKITLQSNTTGGTALRLSGFEVGESISYLGIYRNQFISDPFNRLVLKLRTTDLNSLKAMSSLAVSSDTLFLSFPDSTFEDMSGKPITQISPTKGKQVKIYVEDKVAPSLSSFSLDMHNELLSLTFSETVNVSTLDPLLISLVHHSISHTLSGATSLSLSNHVILSFKLLKKDLDIIKAKPPLATNSTTVVVSGVTGFIRDMNGNNVEDMTGEKAKNCAPDGFTEDKFSPSLTSFEVNLTSEILHLTFSETVNFETLDQRHIKIQSGIYNDTSYHFLSPCSAPLDCERKGQYSTSISLSMLKVDLNVIKSLPDLLTSKESAFLRVSSSLVKDMNGNQVNSLSDGHALKSSAFFGDFVKPTLQGFDLDMNSNLISLKFSETVNSTSIDLRAITIHSVGNSELYGIKQRGSVKSSFKTIVDVQLDISDSNELKRLQKLATHRNDTFLSATSNLVEDMNKNSMFSVDVGSFKQASLFTPDSTSPKLLSYDLDMNNLQLTMTFSETVDAEKVDVSGIIFQTYTNRELLLPSGNFVQVGSFHRLTGGDVSENSNIIVLDLTSKDSNALKTVVDLCDSKITTNIAIESAMISDMSGNEVEQITKNDALVAKSFVADESSPFLKSFSFNLNTRTMSLSFSESMNSSFIDSTGIFIQGVKNNSLSLSPVVNLETASILGSTDLPVINVSFGEKDANALKELSDVAFEENNTFLSLSDGSFKDMVGLRNVGLSKENGMRTASYLNDVEPPIITFFSLNLTTKTVLLVFSEPISSSFNMKRVVIYSSDSNYTLTGGIANGDYKALLCDLNEFDVNRIKLDESLATSSVRSNIKLLDGAVSDVAKFPNFNVMHTKKSDKFGADTIKPVVRSFSVDLGASFLAITYDEPVKKDSVDPSKFQVQAFQNVTSTTGFVILTGAKSIKRSIDGLEITIAILNKDLNKIKEDKNLFKNLDYSWLSFEDDAIRDVSNNPIAAVPKSKAIQASVFLNDTVVPRIASFALDMPLKHSHCDSTKQGMCQLWSFPKSPCKSQEMPVQGKATD